MSLEAAALPLRWTTFLKEVDELLAAPVELHCLGGFVLAAGFSLPRPTADLDYIAAKPAENAASLETIAGRGSPLAKRHGFYFQYVTIADVPEDYEERLSDLFPGQFSRLHLRGLEVHDLILAKLVRNSPVDFEDAKFLAKMGKLEEAKLKQRYEKELRPNLANEARHDLTLELWIEACFHS